MGRNVPDKACHEMNSETLTSYLGHNVLRLAAGAGVTHPTLAVHSLLGVALEACLAEEVAVSALNHFLEGQELAATAALDALARLGVLVSVERRRQRHIHQLRQRGMVREMGRGENLGVRGRTRGC